MNAPTAVPPEVVAARERAERLVDEAAVTFAIDQTSVRLALALADTNPVVLCVMNGGLPYTAELLKRFDFPLQLAYVHVGRYADSTRGGALRWTAKPTLALGARTVLLVDDVCDGGSTLAALVAWARDAGAAQVLTTVLVDKAVSRSEPVDVDYGALRCPDRYLFGCGMDYHGYWRNLPAIYALPEDLAD